VQTDRSYHRQTVLESKQPRIAGFDYQPSDDHEGGLIAVFAPEKADASGNASRRKICTSEIVNGYAAKRSLLQSVDQRLFGERPLQGKNNRIEQTAARSNNCNPAPEAAVLRYAPHLN
jgi:hypothetical protein